MVEQSPISGTEEAQTGNVALDEHAVELACKAHAPHWNGIDNDIKVYAREQMRDAIRAYLAATAPTLPQDVDEAVRRLKTRIAWHRNVFGEVPDDLTENLALSVILSQSAALASAREVIEQVAEGSIDASATAIIIGWPTARTVLDAAREWKGR